MKLLIWIAYGLCLAVGVALLWARRPAPPVRFEAAADLPVGHRLAPGDIRLPGGGHYLRRRVAAGGTVTEHELLALPHAGLRHGMAPLAVALAPGARIDLLEAQRMGWLCPRPTGFSTVRVLSLICAPDDSTCLAVVGVPRSFAKGRVRASLFHDSQCR